MSARFASMLLVAVGLIAACPRPGAGTDAAADPAPGAAGWADHHLRRALFEWGRGDLIGALTQLEAIDPALIDGADEAFPNAPRASFLLGCAYLALENQDGFLELTERLPAGETAGESPLASWLAYLALLERSGRSEAPGGGSGTTVPAPPRGFAASEFLAAHLLVRAGRANDALRLLERFEDDGRDATLLAYARALAADAAGLDSREAWERIATGAGEGPLARDLAGAAALRLAAIAMRDGADPDELLRGVPAGSRFAARAHHLLGARALERGEPDVARSHFDAILDSNPGYAGRREVALARGGLEIESQNWEAAHGVLSGVEEEWTRERERLARLREAPALDSLWTDWRERGLFVDALHLDRGPLESDLAELLAATLDLRAPLVAPAAPGVAVRVPRRDPREPRSLNVTASQGWSNAAAAAGDAAAARYQQRRADRAASDEERALGRRRDYLERGLAASADVLGALRDAAARLDAMIAEGNAIAARLERIRDEELRRIAERTETFRRRAEDQRIVAEALAHFYVDGPNRERAERLPPAVPAPAELLSLEEGLADTIEVWRAAFAELAPALVRRSHDERWRPRVIDKPLALAEQARLHLQWAQRIHDAIDSTLATAGESEALLAYRRDAERWERRAAELAELEARLGREWVAAALDSAMAAASREGEAIHFNLALVTHELGVSLGREEGRAWREESTERMRDFLAAYPESFARGEIRFRLADLQLRRAREEFEQKMARFLDESAPPAAGDERAFAPFVDYAPALSLYEAILDEDRDFPHLDAVLFNAGMIHFDRGEPQADTTLAALVRLYPQSPFCQEAYLRLGDTRFEAREFAECIPLFEKAAAGTDVEFAAISLYKLGWAHFNSDDFSRAAAAFCRLLDLYERDGVTTTADLRKEAEEYLVHSLARAGGASAFEALFARAGSRPYEGRVLSGLSALLRGFSLYDEAAATDSLWLARYPTDPQALAAAARLVETYEFAGDPEAARAARQALAPRFLEGSAWYEQTPDDSLRAAGSEFALSSLKNVALFHHHAARESDDPADWRSARELYERIIATWPDHPERERFHFYAGESAAGVADYPGAIAHFERAARSDTASFRVDAAWQAIAARDAWYESTRSAEPESELGADSLARFLVAAVDTFVSRHEYEPRCADLLWRQGNLCYAHGWYGPAAEGFARLVAVAADDERAPRAAALRAQAFYRLDRFADAGDAYARAIEVARLAGADSLAAELEPLVPLCHFEDAEQAAADSSDPARAARLFREVGRRWPGFEHADMALYRAGLEFERAALLSDAVESWEGLIQAHPRSEYKRDAYLAIASAWKKSERAVPAALAYERFAEAFPEDEGAPSALLEAAELLSAAGDASRAEAIRTRYIAEFPDDVETAMAILAERADRELDGVGPGRPISALLSSADGAGATSEASTSLAAYLTLAAAHPELAWAPIEARAAFLQGEQARGAYERARLTRPLDESIRMKKELLEELLARYRRCAALGVSPWDRAAAFRIGAALVEFGDALMQSERPADLSGDDLVAYDEVLRAQSWEFYDTGETAWTELLRTARSAQEDDGEWIAATRAALWPRIAKRFLHRPEVDFPLVAAEGPRAAADVMSPHASLSLRDALPAEAEEGSR